MSNWLWLLGIAAILLSCLILSILFPILVGVLLSQTSFGRSGQGKEEKPAPVPFQPDVLPAPPPPYIIPAARAALPAGSFAQRVQNIEEHIIIEQNLPYPTPSSNSQAQIEERIFIAQKDSDVEESHGFVQPASLNQPAASSAVPQIRSALEEEIKIEGELPVPLQPDILEDSIRLEQEIPFESQDAQSASQPE